MKLGEALAQRASLQNHMRDLMDRLNYSVVGQEGTTPTEDATKLLDDALDAREQYERLILAINLTNAQTALPTGGTITAALARRDALRAYLRILRGTLDHKEFGFRLGRSELKTVYFHDLNEIRVEADLVSKELRELDVVLQTANWTVDLTEVGS